MIQVQSFNNSGLFQTKNQPTSRQTKKRNARLFIRRSRIYHSLTNNNFYPDYHKQIQHRRVRRKIFNGGGDQKPTPSLSNQQKYIDFTELEHIFDNAIRNRLPIEPHKEKSQTQTLLFHPQSIPKLANPPDTLIDLSNQLPVEDITGSFIHKIKQHKIISAIILVSLSALIGFFSVFIFVK